MRKMIFFTFLILIYVVTTTAYQYLDYMNQALTIEPSSTPQTTTTYYEAKEATLDNKDIVIKLNKRTDDLNNIINKYENLFESLEAEILRDIENLREEILKSMSEDMNAFTFGMTLLKYEQKASNLEETADARFLSLYDEMIEELNNNGHPTDAAEDLEKRYSRTKSRVKRELIREANAWLGDAEEF